MLGAPDTVPGLTPGVLSLRDELAAGQMPVIHTQPLGFTSLTLCHGSDTIWCIIRDENGGGFALRTVHTPGMPFRILSCDVEATGISLTGESPLGTSEMRLTVPDRKNALR
jgi:hypothetical protein